MDRTAATLTDGLPPPPPAAPPARSLTISSLDVHLSLIIRSVNKEKQIPRVFLCGYFANLAFPVVTNVTPTAQKRAMADIVPYRYGRMWFMARSTLMTQNICIHSGVRDRTPSLPSFALLVVRVLKSCTRRVTDA